VPFPAARIKPVVVALDIRRAFHFASFNTLFTRLSEAESETMSFS
jgi:hypothetical protein